MVQSGAQPLLRVQDVAVRFGGIVALDGVSFDVAPGRIVGLIGPNGAGKTTLFNCISRLYECDRGDIAFDGMSLLTVPRHRVAGLGIGRTFQNLALFRTMSVLDNVMVERHCRTRGGLFANALRLPYAVHSNAATRDRARVLGLMTTVMDLSGVRAAYGATRVLHGIDFAMEENSITALLGANGAGKTTTLRAICGMVRTEGAIRFAGKPIQGQKTEDIARLGIAHVPDGRGTFLHLTTEENLRLGAYVRKDRAAVARDLERVYGYFPRLKERAHQQAGTLSGGEQQMLAVSRALILAPKLMLLDEPSFGLAPLGVRELFAILRAINAEERVSILLVVQNSAMALDLADRACVIETGRVVLAAAASELKRNDAVRRSYLGY